jgi:hypothetical protein
VVRACQTGRVRLQRASLALCGQCSHELAAKHLREGVYRKQKASFRHGLLSQRAACYQSVRVKVAAKILLPGVRHARPGFSFNSSPSLVRTDQRFPLLMRSTKTECPRLGRTCIHVVQQ